MLADQLDQHAHLRVEPLVVGLNVLQLGERPFHDVVLFHRFEDRVLRPRRLRPRLRVEQLLLEVGVDGELLDHLVHQLALGLVASGPGPLELPEQILDRPVILLEECDGVHPSPTSLLDPLPAH